MAAPCGHEFFSSVSWAYPRGSEEVSASLLSSICAPSTILTPGEAGHSCAPGVAAAGGGPPDRRAAWIRFPYGPDVALACVGAPSTCVSLLQLRQE